MKTSQQGLDLLTAREGCELTPYLDTVAQPPVWTDGYGNTVGVVPNGPPITLEKAREDLARNLQRFEAAVNESVTVGLEQYQFDALVSFAYNVGEAAFKSSTLLKKINLYQFEAAALQFDRWHIPAAITTRRNGEREQFKGAAFEPRIA